MTKFWEAFGGKLAENWIAALIAPAAVFWATGFGAWVLDRGWDQSGKRLTDWFTRLSGTEQGLLAVGGLLALAGLAAVISSLVPTTLRLLEGYWPSPVRSLWPIAHIRTAHIGKSEGRLQDLERQREKEGQLGTAEETEYVRLDMDLRRVPPGAALRLPTKLGNTLRAAELFPGEKYGLDTVIIWPRLWLVLSDDAREEITNARQQLDEWITVWIWGLLIVVWVILTWWVSLIAFGVVFFAYWRAVVTAEIYGDLVESAFDLQRFELYDQLRIPAPKASADEVAQGQALTRYLWRGEGEMTFTKIGSNG